MQTIIDVKRGAADLVSVAEAVNSMMSEIYGGIGPIPAWKRVGYAIGFGLFSTAAVTNSITLFSLLPRQLIHAIKIAHSSSFSGGGISAYTISVGVAGNAAKYASAFDVFQSPGSRVYQVSMNLDGEDQQASTPITVTATSAGANLNAATAGTVDIWALLSVPTS